MDPQSIVQSMLQRPKHPSMASISQQDRRNHSSQVDLSIQTRSESLNTLQASITSSSMTEKPSSPVGPVEKLTVRFVTGPPRRDHWKPDSSTDVCNSCHTPFSLLFRRHHCRRCGDIFCGPCCSKRIRLDQEAKFHPIGVLSRSCNSCFAEYQTHIVPLTSKSPVDTDDEMAPESNFGSLQPALHSAGPHSTESAMSSFTQGESANTLSIPIMLKDPSRDMAETPLMSVPSDWAWSTF